MWDAVHLYMSSHCASRQLLQVARDTLDLPSVDFKTTHLRSYSQTPEHSVKLSLHFHLLHFLSTHEVRFLSQTLLEPLSLLIFIFYKLLKNLN